MLFLFLILLILFIIIPKLFLLYFNNNQNIQDIWTNEKLHFISKLFFISVQNFAIFWHKYEIHGIENIKSKNSLLVGYHSRCTVDGVYTQAFLQGTTIMSPIFFAIPLSKQLFNKIHCVSTHSHGLSSEQSFIQTVINGNRPTILYPGGYHECYKTLDEKYKVKWKEIPGYARILLSEPNRPGSETSVIPFYTHNSEEIYLTTDWWYNYSSFMIRNDFHNYENGNHWLLPFLFPKSILALGFILIPKPVKLDLYIGKPLTPYKDETDKQFAKRVEISLQELIDNTKNLKQSNNERTIKYMLFNYPIYTLYTFIQMTLFWSLNFILYIFIVPFILIFVLLIKKSKKIKNEQNEQNKNN